LQNILWRIELISIFHNIIFPKIGILHIKLLSPGMESGLGRRRSLCIATTGIIFYC